MADSDGREAFVEALLARMSVEDKVGQCITFEFHGTVLSPGLRRKILNLRCGGLRASPHVHEGLPYGVRKTKEADTQRRAPWAGPAEYATTVNELQRLAMSRGPGIPLHISMDCEGDLSCDFARGGAHLLPSQMGMRATGDIRLARRCWRILARQLRAAGVNMLHSPAVDIDFVPNNPTVGVRAFADTPEVCAKWGVALMESLVAEGVIPAAKHYMGRGYSTADTHFGADVNDRSIEQMMAGELLPYRRVIEAGIPAIMVSHTMYKAIDPEGVPASVSRRVVEFTRNELGFDGVLTTDAIGMGGVLDCFGGDLPKAARAALAAGNDLVLIKTTEQLEVACWREITAAVNQGLISEAQLDASVRRILRMKYDHGLFGMYPVDPAKAMAPIRSRPNKASVARAARACCTLLCDDDAILPLEACQKVLVVEPYYPLLMDRGNDFYWHSSMLWELMGRYSPNVSNHEVLNGGSVEDIEAIVAESADYDVCVVVCQKFRSFPSSSPVAEKLIEAGRKVVVLSTNPYEFSIPPNARCVLVTYGQVPPLLANAADVLYGQAAPEGTWPLAHYTSPFDRVGAKSRSGPHE